MRDTFALTTVVLLLVSVALAQSPGETVFTQHCVACHGSDLAGHTAFGRKANIPDLRASVVQSRSDNDLIASIGRGEGHKEYPHGFLSRGLSIVQIKTLITYIRSMSTVAAPVKK